MTDTKKSCLKPEHKELIYLPCNHKACKICFFENMSKENMSKPGPSFICHTCDYEYTYDSISKLAKNGDCDALYILGYMFHTDVKKAEEYYTKCLKHTKIIEGMCIDRPYIHADIGTFYYIILDNNDKAFEHYSKMHKMIEHNKSELFPIYSYELQILAKLHLCEGRNYYQNRKESHNILLDLSRICPDKTIYKSLGKMYRRGIGVFQDYVEAYKLYELADCKYVMGCILSEIDNHEKAIEILKQVPNDINDIHSKRIYSKACIKIGDICEKKFFRHNDAIEWYKRSIYPENCMGLIYIGDLYLKGGHLFEKDYIQAGIQYNVFLEKNKDQGCTHIGHARLSSLYGKIQDEPNSDRCEKLRRIAANTVTDNPKKCNKKRKIDN